MLFVMRALPSRWRARPSPFILRIRTTLGAGFSILCFLAASKPAFPMTFRRARLFVKKAKARVQWVQEFASARECSSGTRLAIDPLNPSFWVGAESRLVLADPAYSAFAAALREAPSEKITRPVIARALMQSDLWATYDILFGPFLLADEKELGLHRQEADRDLSLQVLFQLP
jgi:hypothetical protein